MSAGVGAGDDPPATREVARELGIASDTLRQFVDSHPDPRPEYILALAGGGEADPRRVGAWIDRYEREKQRRREEMMNGGQR